MQLLLEGRRRSCLQMRQTQEILCFSAVNPFTYSEVLDDQSCHIICDDIDTAHGMHCNMVFFLGRTSASCIRCIMTSVVKMG